MPPDVKVGKETEGPFEGSWSGICTGGDSCGNYRTRGWPTKAIATERILQHQDEHASGEENPGKPDKFRLMEPQEKFMERHGLVRSGNGNTAVFPADMEGIKFSKVGDSGGDS